MTNFDLNTDFSSTLVVSLHFILQFFFNNVVSKKWDKRKSFSSINNYELRSSSEHCNCCVHKLKFQFFLSTFFSFVVFFLLNKKFIYLFRGTSCSRAVGGLSFTSSSTTRSSPSDCH